MGVYSNALTQCDYMTVTGDIGSHAATAFQYDLLTTSISTSFIPTLTMQGQWSMARNGPTAGSHHYLFRVYWGGTEYIAKDNTTSGTYAEDEYLFGCVNATGAPSQFIIDVITYPIFGTTFCGGYMDEADMVTLMDAIQDYNLALGRNPY